MCSRGGLVAAQRNFYDNFVANHEAEDWLQIQERKYGLQDTNYQQFIFLLKRYGYKDLPFTDHMFSHICPELGIDHSEFDNEDKEDKDKELCQVYKSNMLFDIKEGCYNVRNLAAFGFMFCEHSSLANKKDDFWVLCNPEVNPTVKRETIKEVMRILFYFAIEVRLKIEEKKGAEHWKNDVIDYLRAADGSTDEMIEKYAFHDLPRQEDMTEKQF